MSEKLLEEYRAARARLNTTLDLLERVMDLREQLGFGFDSDDMRDAAGELLREVRRHKGTAFADVEN